MNIDVVSNQYSLDDLYEQAQKLGLEMEDLKEYGFDVRGVNCGGKMCFSGGKSYEDFVLNSTGMTVKMALN
jgi:hypothetical protein|tara:strand:+ start:377 stop:589 length:213 start_codon:yes stop_codon:yes gene_type:complete